VLVHGVQRMASRRPTGPGRKKFRESWGRVIFFAAANVSHIVKPGGGCATDETRGGRLESGDLSLGTCAGAGEEFFRIAV
jgi:hypothetical protein